MELDDLKRAWHHHDRKLDEMVRLNRRLLRDSVLGKTETAVTRLARWLWLELAVTLAMTVWLGSFNFDHIGEARFLLPGLALQACWIGLIVTCVRQLVALHQLDYGAPIVSLQKRLESLRIERIGVTKWALLSAPLAWTPLFIVAMKALVGIDVYPLVSTAWLVTSVLFGLLVIAAGVWFCRRYADRIQRTSLARQVMRDIAGHNLTAALGFLRSLSEFEQEPDNGVA